MLKIEYFNGSFFISLLHSFSIYSANSQVGDMIIEYGMFEDLSCIALLIKGNKYANVLPLPGGDIAIKFSPAVMIGND